jgi:hypothetical protein
MLKNDCFAEDRLLAFPPGVAVLLVCFSRFHNYAVQQLATINEGGKFSVPDRSKIGWRIKAATTTTLTNDQIEAAIDEAYAAAIVKRDNDLFQTGRLYIFGWF